jgi:hypothetical protein
MKRLENQIPVILIKTSIFTLYPVTRKEAMELKFCKIIKQFYWIKIQHSHEESQIKTSDWCK